MAYAELWQPIQGAISSLNQTINTVANREDRRAAMGLQSIMQMDSLEGTAFDRKQKKAAGQRAERQLEMQEDQMTFNQKYKEAEAARIREIDRLQAPIRKAAAMEAEEKLKPKPVNFYNFLPQDAVTQKWAFDDTQAAKRMATAIGGEGAYFDRNSGALLDAKGNQMQRTGFQLKGAAPGIHGIVTAYSDPTVQQSEYVASLEDEVKERQAAVTKLKRGNGSVDRSQRLMPQIKQAESELQRAQLTLDRERGKKPWKLIENYETRQRVLDSFTAQYAFNGGEPQALTVLMNASKENSDQLQGLRKQKYDALYGDTKDLVVRYAQKVDDKGNVLETRVISAPKTKKGVLPEDVDERLLASDGWVWDKQVASKKLGKGSDSAWVAGYDRGAIPFTKKGEAGQWMIKPGMQQAHSAYSRLFEKKYEDTKNPMTAGNEARDLVIGAEEGYWAMARQIANTQGWDLIEDQDAINEVMKVTPFAGYDKVGPDGEGSIYNQIEGVLEYIPDNPKLSFQ